jgi:hypothetical protein
MERITRKTVTLVLKYGPQRIAKWSEGVKKEVSKAP